ncbi:MAG: O-antigen ligase family protein [Methylacidiphilales bacterium]|nr:O-antigen ligase family protein [Candidatus Methylacidiphilales bacterium]
MNKTHKTFPRRLDCLPLTFSVNEIVVTFWTCVSFYIMFATGGNNEFWLFLPLVVGAIVLVLMTYKKRAVAKVDPMLSFGVFLLVFGILASYLFNSQRYDPIYILGNLVSVALLFVSLYTITTKINLDFRKTLVFQCIFATPLFPVVLATATDHWGRLEPAELQANYVSMMAMLCFIGACSVRSLPGVLALSVLPLYTIVAMQSRDSLLAAVVAVLIIGGYHLRRLGWQRLRPYAGVAFLAGPIVCIALYFLGFNVFAHVYNVFDSLFLLNDEHRGINSGGSGRTELWNAALNLWLSHPFFGVGFKGHPYMMPDMMYAHSAYLGMLADVGLVGSAGYMIIVGVALYRTVKRGALGLTEYPQRMAILISYLIYGLLESRAFSFGNSYSLLFLLVAFDSSKVRLGHAPALELPQVKPPSVLPGPVAGSAVKASLAASRNGSHGARRAANFDK